MTKKVGLISMFALAVLVFMIWTDPAGAATTVGHFFGEVGGFLKELLNKLTDFLSGLGEGSKPSPA